MAKAPSADTEISVSVEPPPDDDNSPAADTASILASHSGVSDRGSIAASSVASSSIDFRTTATSERKECEEQATYREDSVAPRETNSLRMTFGAQTTTGFSHLERGETNASSTGDMSRVKDTQGGDHRATLEEAQSFGSRASTRASTGLSLESLGLPGVLEAPIEKLLEFMTEEDTVSLSRACIHAP